MVWVQVDVVLVLDQFDRVFDQGQGLQSQEIHLQQTGIFYYRVIELGDIQVGVFGSSYRDKLRNIVGSDDHPASVNSGIPQRTFQDFGLLYGFP